jgi:hypothetical protein
MNEFAQAATPSLTVRIVFQPRITLTSFVSVNDRMPTLHSFVFHPRIRCGSHMNIIQVGALVTTFRHKIPV